MAPQNLWLHRFAKLTVAAAFFVIFAGAMVTSTRSGMAVPDWPQSFGVWMPKMVGGVFYEHGHRMAAGTAALLTTALAFWSAWAEPRAAVRWVAWAAFIAILVQAALGGLTVLMGTYYGWDRTSPVVSAVHASLAQAVFSLLLSFAALTEPGWKLAKRGSSIKMSLQILALATVAAVYVQIVLGAVLRQQGAGLIIPDFPLSYGRLIPDFYEWRVGLAFAHRSWAFVVLLLALFLGSGVLRLKGAAWLKAPARILLAAISVQMLLGACTIWSRLSPLVASGHVLGGSLVLGSSVVLALRIVKVGGLAKN